MTKNNAGLDWTQLFIGAEGTLGAAREPYEYAAHLPRVPGFDMSIPRRQMQRAVDELRAAMAHLYPAERFGPFGHVGDSNLHVIATLPDAGANAAKAGIESLVYGVVAAHDGAISAEHGIGQAKRSWLHLSRMPAEFALLRRLKAALDPAGILNNGRVLEQEG